MLEYDRIDISEGIGINKINVWKERNICHYWYFKDVGFKYEPYLCNGCHNLMQKAMHFNDFHFCYMSKDDAISIMNNYNLVDKKGVFSFFFSLYKRWLSTTLLNTIPLKKFFINETEMWHWIEKNNAMKMIKKD